MQFPKETEVSGQTPEELLHSLEAKIAFYRARRPETSQNRTAILTLAILGLITAAGISLLVLSKMLPQAPLPAKPGPPGAASAQRH